MQKYKINILCCVSNIPHTHTHSQIQLNILFLHFVVNDIYIIYHMSKSYIYI